MLSIPAREWPTTMQLAKDRAAEGRFEAADSLMAGFAAQFAGSREALETAYWRALFRIDPSNHAGSLTSAMALLDSYLTDNRPRDHVTEAGTLRRIAGQVETLAKATGGVQREVIVSQRPGETKPAEAGSSDAEVKRLKDELAKANAELERIRRRLAQPPKEPD